MDEQGEHRPTEKIHRQELKSKLDRHTTGLDALSQAVEKLEAGADVVAAVRLENEQLRSAVETLEQQYEELSHRFGQVVDVVYSLSPDPDGFKVVGENTRALIKLQDELVHVKSKVFDILSKGSEGGVSQPKIKRKLGVMMVLGMTESYKTSSGIWSSTLDKSQIFQMKLS